MAAALGALGLRRAAVVHGEGKIDELAVRGETFVALWDGGVVRDFALTPRVFGLDEVDPAGLTGGDATYNAGVLRKVLAGHQIDHGERLEAALHASAMTAALGLELLEPAFERGRLPQQYRRAVESVRSGAARLVLHKWREVSQAGADISIDDLAALKPSDFAGVE